MAKSKKIPALFDIDFGNPFGTFDYNYTQEAKRVKHWKNISNFFTFFASMSVWIITMMAVMFLFPQWGIVMAIIIGIGGFITEGLTYHNENIEAFTIVWAKHSSRSLIEFVLGRALGKHPEYPLIHHLKHYTAAENGKALAQLLGQISTGNTTYTKVDLQQLITGLEDRVRYRHDALRLLNKVAFWTVKGDLLNTLELHYDTTDTTKTPVLRDRVLKKCITNKINQYADNVKLPRSISAADENAFRLHLKIEAITRCLADLGTTSEDAADDDGKKKRLPPAPKSDTAIALEARNQVLVAALKAARAELEQQQASWKLECRVKQAVHELSKTMDEQAKRAITRSLAQSLMDKHHQEIVTKIHGLRTAKVTAAINGLFMGFAAFVACSVALWYFSTGNFTATLMLGASTPLWCIIGGAIFGTVVVFAFGMLMYRMYDRNIKENLFKRIWNGLKQAYIPKRGFSNLEKSDKFWLAVKWIVITLVLLAILGIAIYVNLALAGAFLESSLQTVVLPFQAFGWKMASWMAPTIFWTFNVLINVFILPTAMLFSIEHSTNLVQKIRGFCSKVGSRFKQLCTDKQYAKDFANWIWKCAKILGPLRCIGYVLGFLIISAALLVHVVGEGAFSGEGTFAPSDLGEFFASAESPFDPVFAWFSSLGTTLFGAKVDEKSMATALTAFDELGSNGDFVVSEEEGGRAVYLFAHPDKGAAALGGAAAGVGATLRDTLSPSKDRVRNPASVSISPLLSQSLFAPPKAAGPASRNLPVVVSPVIDSTESSWESDSESSTSDSEAYSDSYSSSSALSSGLYSTSSS